MPLILWHIIEKENNETALASCEHFFSQYEDSVSSNEVSTRIDANTSNLHKNHPKFYTITINPSQKELAHLTKHSSNLKDYVRELMKHYAPPLTVKYMEEKSP